MEGINEYILDRSIAELPEDSIQEFWDIDYGMFERGYGIVRIFPGEVFYSAKNNIFLGRECIHTVVAALNGKIYKVLFRFISPSTQEYDAFREDAYNYLTDKFGPPTKARRPSEFERISIWDGDFGNVILDINMLGTSVIYTSSVLRPKKKSLLQRLFGSYWLRQSVESRSSEAVEVQNGMVQPENNDRG
jgi:hypothetical protein